MTEPNRDSVRKILKVLVFYGLKFDLVLLNHISTTNLFSRNCVCKRCQIEGYFFRLTPQKVPVQMFSSMIRKSIITTWSQTAYPT